MFNFLKRKSKSLPSITEPVFSKVPYSQFRDDIFNLYSDKIDEEAISNIYNQIKIPERSTGESAGYDFIAPFGFSLYVGESIVIPTGIRCEMPNCDVLLLMPRSGQGFKYRLRLANTTGVIDADYARAKNHGHIMIKLVYEGIDKIVTPKDLVFHTKDNSKEFEYAAVDYEAPYLTPGNTDVPRLNINMGDAFTQGIITTYQTVKNDFYGVGAVRIGGIGSTSR